MEFEIRCTLLEYHTIDPDLQRLMVPGIDANRKIIYDGERITFSIPFGAWR
jgi:hypothetical protein